MNIEYSTKHIQEAIARIHNKKKDFETAILETSSAVTIDEKASKIKEIILSKDDPNEAKKNNIAITEASTDFIKSLHSYLHRLGIETESLIIAQTIINMKLCGKNGLNNGKVTVIPFEQTEDISLKIWLSIIDEQFKHTLDMAYDYDLIKTEQMKTDLCRACSHTVSSICSLVYALGINLEYDDFDIEKQKSIVNAAYRR